VSPVRGWSAGTNRRFGLLLALSTVASLVFGQRLTIRVGVPPEASWPPALATTGLVLAAAVAGYLLTGRGRRYTEVPASLRPDLDRLTAAYRLARRPEFVVNPRALSTGAVTLGRVRRYRLVLEAGLVCRAERSPARFTAVVLHELAHVRNRDVEVAQLAVALWRVTSIAILLPYLAVSLWSARHGPDPAAARRDATLALAVSAVLYLMYAEVLRKRELYADRDAVMNGADPRQWSEPAYPGGRRSTGVLLRELANVCLTPLRSHPTPDQRRRALSDPDSWVASSMIGESLLTRALAFAAMAVMFTLLTRPELGPGAPAEWPAWLKAGINYPTMVISVAALLIAPNRRYDSGPVRYAPMYARHRRSAAIRLAALFAVVTVLLFAWDPAHLLDDDWPYQITAPLILNPPPPTNWPAPQTVELAQRTRAWLLHDGNATLGRLTEDLIATKDRIRATRPRHIDWRSFAPDCAAVHRDLATLRSLDAFPAPDVDHAWTTAIQETRNAMGVLCRPGHTPREYQKLVDVGEHAERAGVALNTVFQVLGHYLAAG
jgi:Zn-dependent protease with chaperone function